MNMQRIGIGIVTIQVFVMVNDRKTNAGKRAYCLIQLWQIFRLVHISSNMSEISHKMKEKVYKYNNSSDIITHKEFFVNQNCM